MRNHSQIKPLLPLLFALLSAPCFAQNFQSLQELKSSLAAAKDDTSKVLILSALSFNYAFVQPDTGVLYGQQAIALAKKGNNKKGEAFAMFSYGWALWSFGDYDKAVDFSLKSLKLFQDRQDYEMMVSVNNLLAVILRDVKDYRMALSYSNTAKKLTDSLGFYNKSVVLSASPGATFAIRSSIFHLSGQIDSADYYMKKFFPGNPQNYGAFPVALMGRIAMAKKDYSKALFYFKTSIPTALNRIDILDTYTGMADLYLETGKTDSSIYYCKEVLEKWSNTFYRRAIKDAVNTLASCYKRKNISDSAIKYLEMSVAMSDSLYSQEKIRSIQNLNFNAQLQKQEEDAAKAAFQNRVKLYMLLGLLGVFLLIGIMLFRNNNQRKKANALLQAQKDKVEITLSELKSTQAQLIQSEKMASLGELTAGIAHEIQNPLNFVNNFSEVNTELIDELKTEFLANNKEEVMAIANDIKENEQKILHHGKRADAIVKGMLQHSRVSTGQKELTDINALADEYLRLSYHGLHAKDKSFNATIQTDFDEGIEKIKVVPQDIGRVLLNLFNNAFYAVKPPNPLKGEHYEPTVIVSTKKIGDKVLISVKDNGIGISQKVVDKIFQPFFTTKPAGQGTGLGLSLSYDIIKAHGGEIKVETKEGEGSEFIIRLPTL